MLLLKNIEKGTQKLVDALAAIGGFMFVGLMFFGFSDIIGRYAFNSPITGANEVSVILMAGLVLFSWAYTQKWEGHVIVDLVISHYSPRAKAISQFIALALSLILFIIIVWQSSLVAVQYAREGYSLQILDFPSYPFRFFVPVAGFCMCLEVIIQICHTAPKMKKEQKEERVVSI